MAKSSFFFASSYFASSSFHFASCIFAIVGEVVLLAVERRLLEFDAEHARRAAADVHLAARDDRRAFEVDEVAGQCELPQRFAGRRVDAVQHAAGVLVHAVAEDEVVPRDGRRTDRRELQVRGGLRPRRLRAGSSRRAGRREIVGRLNAPMPAT